MPTKEQDFKERLIAAIRDLKDRHTEDAELMWLVGSLGARLVDLYKLKTWTQFKAKLSGEAYNRLLKDFEQQGNAYHRDGKAKASYAIQLLAISVVAKTQDDPQVKEGARLLDGLINGVVANYRKSRSAKAT